MTAMRTDASTGELQEVPEAIQAKPDKKQLPAMHVKVYSPFKVYFDENAYSISGINQTGPFDILPHHHNFMTLLTQGELRIRNVRQHEQVIRISGGLMYVKADRVIVFLDI